MFAIVFAIIFGLWSNVGRLSSSFKFGFFIVAITFVIEALLCILSLYGRKKEDLGFVRFLAKLSIIVLFMMIIEMVAMLSSLLTM